MSIYVPYDNKLETTNGAFISPNHEIMYVDKDHELFAYNYCYTSNSLKRERLLLFKRWLMTHRNISDGMFSDFMTLVIGFDKADTIMKKSITTTTMYPYTKYYNYYLMDWYIDCQKGLVYNKETNQFEEKDSEEFEYARYLDMEMKEEIEDIKRNVLRKERPLFFK